MLQLWAGLTVCEVLCLEWTEPSPVAPLQTFTHLSRKSFLPIAGTGEQAQGSARFLVWMGLMLQRNQEFRDVGGLAWSFWPISPDCSLLLVSGSRSSPDSQCLKCVVGRGLWQQIRFPGIKGFFDRPTIWGVNPLTLFVSHGSSAR